MAMFGGGFEFGGGAFASQQEQGGAKGGRQQKDATLRAVTIRQLAQAAAGGAPDQDLSVDGADLSNVTLVGRVVSAEERGGNLDLQVSDGTGMLPVTYYVENAEGDPQAMAQRAAELRPGTYVRVYGHLRAAKDSWAVSAFAARAVHDFNEVTYHYLQAIFQHIHLTKGTGKGGAAAAQQAGLSSFGAPVAGGWQQPQQQHAPQGGGHGGAAAGGPPGMEPCAAAVLQVVSDPSSAGDQGIHVNEICGRLAGKFGRQQVEAALNHLQNEAHAYTTCDESHWRAT
ncbi:MAG: hypothetical protein J3K34DRAFT_427696 [Monoraphidium minutum]|nr:MAG: hypothetical protein J3K34DRAFT_427696 [Monoraphidium minutum]